MLPHSRRRLQYCMWQRQARASARPGPVAASIVVFLAPGAHHSVPPQQVGLWGYLTGFEELLAQDSSITDVVLSCGSGGSVAGMALANHLLGDKVKVHAISVCDDEVWRRAVPTGGEGQVRRRSLPLTRPLPVQDYFHGHVDETLSELGLGAVRSRDILNVVDGFKGRGYGLSTGGLLTEVSCPVSSAVSELYPLPVHPLAPLPPH